MNEVELSTEEKIRQAASRVFIRKGFSATKTRDIAEEAGINVASLHYYYRSKDKLFEIVALDALKNMSQGISDIIDQSHSLQEMIKMIVNYYTDFFYENPHIPMFILSESQTNPDKIEPILNMDDKLQRLSKKLESYLQADKVQMISAYQLFLNIIGLTVFPFIAKPPMKVSGIHDEQFKAIIEERRILIPKWVSQMLYHPAIKE